MVPKICSVEDCERTDLKREWCKKHYNLGLLDGSISPLPRMSTSQRFWSKVNKSGGCWIWTAAVINSGYGTFSVGKRSTTAHRFAYEEANGTIDDRMVVDHTCHNKMCVNPAHLRSATQKQNAENPGVVRSDNTSGIPGVSWHRASKKWRADIRHNYERIHVGTFADLEDAKRAVVAKRLELFTHNDHDRALASLE